MMSVPDGGEERPVLHVKRGAVVMDEGPDRDGPYVPPPGGRQRTPPLLGQRGRPTGSPKAGRRGRVASLLALVLVAFALLFVFRIQTRPGSASLSGYRVTLRAVPLDGLLAVSVSLVRDARAGEEAGSARARFLLPDTGAEAVVEQPLSAAVILASRLPFEGTERSVSATVRIGGSELALTIELPRQRRKP